MTKLSRRALVLGSAAACLVLVLAGWLLLVSPRRSEAAALDEDVGAVREQISTRLAELGAARTNPAVAVDLFRLVKVLPTALDVPDVLLDLTDTASASGVVLRSLSPGTSSVAEGVEVLPLTVVVHGRYPSIVRYLQRLRALVVVRNGRLSSRGRLFSVEAVSLAPGEGGPPRLQATVTLATYAYEPLAAAPAEPQPAPAGEKEPAAADGAP